MAVDVAVVAPELLVVGMVLGVTRQEWAYGPGSSQGNTTGPTQGKQHWSVNEVFVETKLGERLPVEGHADPVGLLIERDPGGGVRCDGAFRLLGADHDRQ